MTAEVIAKASVVAWPAPAGWCAAQRMTIASQVARSARVDHPGPLTTSMAANQHIAVFTALPKSETAS
jgi:hypothetical protein